MRVGFAIVCGLVVAGVAAAQDAPKPRWTDQLSLSASDRMRGEFVDFFTPKPGKANDGAEQYNFFANQLRVGVKVTSPGATFFAEVQDTRLVNLPDDASLSRRNGGNLGTGAIYFANTHRRDQGEVFFKQGFINVRQVPGVPGAGITLGRFEYSDGLEVLPSDPSLLWLKRQRIGERLIGPFGFTHVTRSFDGGRATYDDPHFNLTAIGTRPTFGGFEVGANRELDVWLAGLTLTLKQLEGLPPFDARLFYLFYQDERTATTPADNRLSAGGPVDHRSLDIHTWGGHALTVVDAGPGRIDGLLWGAVQGGRWGGLDHVAWAWAAETGYQLPRVPTAPWLRVGYNRGSGDDNAADHTHQTFFQILPTARIYAQFPFYNLMNSDDLFAQLLLKPHSMVQLRGDYHWLRLGESQDLWYSGGGATSNTFFGFQGLESGRHSELAHVTEASITVNPLQYLSASAYYSHAFGQGVVKSTFAGSGADYGFVEVSLRY